MDVMIGNQLQFLFDRLGLLVHVRFTVQQHRDIIDALAHELVEGLIPVLSAKMGHPHRNPLHIEIRTEEPRKDS
ncbi:hypothetical protein D1872_316190 [compost metagenome]